MIEFVVLICLTFVGYFIWLRLQKFKLRQSLGYVGPSNQNFVLGDLPAIAECFPVEEDRHLIITKWLEQYGPVFGFHFGSRLEIVIADLDLLKEVLIKNFSCFENRVHPVGQKRSVINLGMITQEGKQWKRVRHALTPTFSSGKMRAMASTIRDKTKILIEKFEKKAASGVTFDIYDDWQALTLDVIARIAFALESKCQTDNDDLFLVNCKQFFQNFDLTKSTFLLAALAFPEFDWFFSLYRPYSKVGKAEKVLIDCLRSVMSQRREAKDLNSVDILHTLLEKSVDRNPDPRNENLSDDEIAANSMIFLLAGYETTSTALAYTSWLLATHPDVQKRLQIEIEDKVGNQEVSYDLVHKLTYLDAVFHESLRIFPPVIAFVSRTCVTACEISGYKFLPGMSISAAVYAIHHDPNVWPEPEKFDPDRFMGENDYHPMAWLPFGTGPRNCIGMRFADMEYKMALVETLRRFNIVLGPDSPKNLPKKQVGPLLRPHQGVMIKLEKR